MRRVVIAVVATTCLAIAAYAPPAVRAQNLSAVGFRNETPVPLIIQGWSLIGGVQRRGAPLVVAPGRVTFDIGIPSPTIRFYTVHNANQPAIILLRDYRVALPGGDFLLEVRPSLQNPGQVDLILAAAAP